MKFRRCQACTPGACVYNTFASGKKRADPCCQLAVRILRERPGPNNFELHRKFLKCRLAAKFVHPPGPLRAVGVNTPLPVSPVLGKFFCRKDGQFRSGGLLVGDRPFSFPKA